MFKRGQRLRRKLRAVLSQSAWLDAFPVHDEEFFHDQLEAARAIYEDIRSQFGQCAYRY